MNLWDNKTVNMKLRNLGVNCALKIANAIGK